MIKFFLTLFLILTGIAIAALLGRMNERRKTGNEGMGAFAITICITIGVVFAVGFSIAGCVSVRLCTSGGDTDLSYVFYPVLAAPLYWYFAKFSR